MQISTNLRLILLTCVLIGLSVGTSLYFSHIIARNAQALVEESELVSVMASAHTATRTFGELKYWVTGLAASLLTRSERKAEAALAAMQLSLDELNDYNSDVVSILRVDVGIMYEQAINAVDAYTNEQRVVGNTLMAQAHGVIEKIDRQLAMLTSDLHDEVRHGRERLDNRIGNASSSAWIIIALTSLLGCLMCYWIVRSLPSATQSVVGSPRDRVALS